MGRGFEYRYLTTCGERNSFSLLRIFELLYRNRTVGSILWRRPVHNTIGAFTNYMLLLVPGVLITDARSLLADAHCRCLLCPPSFLFREINSRHKNCHLCLLAHRLNGGYWRWLYKNLPSPHMPRPRSTVDAMKELRNPYSCAVLLSVV